MHSTSNHTASVDQIEATVREVRLLTSRTNGWLADPEIGDAYVGEAVRRAASGRVLFTEIDDKGWPAPRPRQVNGNSVDFDDADPVDSERGLLTLIGKDECVRCVGVDQPARHVRNALWIGAGVTVVELGFCNVCADELDRLVADLDWEVRARRAAV